MGITELREHLYQPRPLWPQPKSRDPISGAWLRPRNWTWQIEEVTDGGKVRLRNLHTDHVKAVDAADVLQCTESHVVLALQFILQGAAVLVERRAA